MMSVHVVYVLVGPVIYSFRNPFVNNDCGFFLFLTLLIKRIEKTKNRVKNDLETAIKVTDSKHVEFFLPLNRPIPNGKKWNLLFNIGLKHREFRQAFAKQKRLRDFWGFFDRRENDLLKQKIRIFRVLDKIKLFSIDNDGAKFFDGSAKISFNQNPERYNCNVPML